MDETINITLPVKDAANLKTYLESHRDIVSPRSKSRESIDVFLKAYREAVESLPA